MALDGQVWVGLKLDYVWDMKYILKGVQNKLAEYLEEGNTARIERFTFSET